jgi:hypothetical protein
MTKGTTGRITGFRRGRRQGNTTLGCSPGVGYSTATPAERIISDFNRFCGGPAIGDNNFGGNGFSDELKPYGIIAIIFKHRPPIIAPKPSLALTRPGSTRLTRSANHNSPGQKQLFRPDTRQRFNQAGGE